MRTNHARPALLALLLTVTLAACASGGSDGGDTAAEPASEARAFADESADGVTRSAPAGASAEAPAEKVASAVGRGLDEAEKKVAHGSVSLESSDVGDTRFEVQRIVDGLAGEVAESQTETGEDGEVVRSRMVLRIPVADFDEAMDRIEKAADLVNSDQGSDVVTDVYVDLRARVRAQERSLERVELLFTRAQSIRDIMAIESQLSSRQADLDSLKGQLRALEDRTSMSTITVHVEQPPATVEQREDEDEDEAGFLVGLRGGLDALAGTATAVATVVGALLPFLLTGLVIGVPVWLLVRRLRRRPAAATPTGAGAGPAAG